MLTPLRRLVRFSISARSLLAAAVSAVTLASAGAALAAGGSEEPPPVETYLSYTLTVAPPATGSVTTAGINCTSSSSPGSADCTDITTYTCVDGECGTPETKTLSATRTGTGWEPTWTGCTAVNGTGASKTCDVEMSQDRNVSVSWSDAQNPTVSLGTVAAKSGSSGIAVSATASDNDVVQRVEFYVDGGLRLTDSAAPYGGAISTVSYAHGTTHTVTARAFDSSGRTSATSAGQSTLVDRQATVAIAPTLDSEPHLRLAPSLGFTLDSDMTAQCRATLSGTVQPPFSSCASPFVPALTQDGYYMIEVRGTDDVGNTTTASRYFTLDTVQPTAAFTDGPPEGAIVGSSTVTFSFSASDSAPFSVECSLDSGAYGPCTGATSHTLSGVSAGSHALHVRVRDAAGNDRVITRNFAIPQAPGPQPTSTQPTGTQPTVPGAGEADTTPPLVKLAGKSQKLKSRALVFSISSNEGGIAAAKAAFGKVALATLSQTVTAGTTKLKLKLSTKAQKALAKALKRKKSVSIKLTVTVRDLAGNARVVSGTIKLGR